jgi:hypothetical protein
MFVDEKKREELMKNHKKGFCDICGGKMGGTFTHAR